MAGATDVRVRLDIKTKPTKVTGATNVRVRVHIKTKTASSGS